jgi:hypothetical protein
VSEYRIPEEDTPLKDQFDESAPAEEGDQHVDLGGAAEDGGQAGGGSGEVSHGDELLDAGPPADGIADPEGSSGAEEGLSPWDDDSYSEDPQGPSQVAGD